MSAPETYDWADERYRCDACHAWLYVTRFVIEHAFEMVGGGWDLGGAVMGLHLLSGHRAFTGNDLVAHDIAVPH